MSDFDGFNKEKRSEEQIATGGNYLYPALTDGSLCRFLFPLATLITADKHNSLAELRLWREALFSWLGNRPTNMEGDMILSIATSHLVIVFL